MACVPHKAARQQAAMQNLEYLKTKLRSSSDSCRCCKHRLEVLKEGNTGDKFNDMSKAQIKELLGAPNQETDKMLTYRLCVQDVYGGGDTAKVKYWGKIVFEFRHQMVRKAAFKPL